MTYTFNIKDDDPRLAQLMDFTERYIQDNWTGVEVNKS